MYVAWCLYVIRVMLECEHTYLCMYSRQQYNVNVSFCFRSVFLERFDRSTVRLSTVLRSVFRPFYGPSFDRSAVRLSCVLWKRFEGL